MQVYKDLGRGAHPAEERWLSAAGGADAKRDAADFGRMRQAFLDDAARQDAADYDAEEYDMDEDI